MKIYLWGCIIAGGMSLAAIVRGEGGIAGAFYTTVPKKVKVCEYIIAILCSWGTIGFCLVQNAYRSSGR